MAAPFCPVAFCILILAPATLDASSSPAIAVPGVQERSASAWLADLSHPAADVRLAARKWLVRHLEEAEWPALVEVAGGGDFAARRALAQVLAEHPRHFGLAARLTVQPEAAVAEVGEWALQESALAWNPNLVEQPLGVADFPEAWRTEGGRVDILEVHPSWPSPGGLSVSLDRLQLFGDAPVDLVLDPGLDARRRLRNPVRGDAGPLIGSWPSLLMQLVKQHRVTLQVIGWRPEPLDGLASEELRSPSPFVRVCARGDTTEPESGAELLAGWVRGAAQRSDHLLAEACANSLAQVGWPAAVAWLGQLWFQGVPDFTEAVCIGAARQHMAPVLLTKGGVTLLLELGSSTQPAATGRDWNRALLSARALRALPDVLGDGTPLGDVLLMDWAGGLGSPWLICSAYAGRFRVHEGLALRALEWVQNSELPAEQRRVALAAFVSAGGTQVGPVKNLSAMGLGLEPASAEAWVRDMELAGIWPASEAGFEALPALAPGLGRFAFWWFVVGSQERAEAYALRAAQSENGWDAWVAALAVPLERGRRQEVLSWVERLMELRPELGRRLALRLSLLDGAQAFALLESILAKSERSAQDQMDLAYLAPMKVVGARARGALIGALEGNPIPAGLGAALEQAQFNLRSAGSFLLAEEFEGDLRRKAVRASHPLTDRILEDGWGQRPVLGLADGGRAPLGATEEMPPH